jgi:DNA-binding transcriptional ArsR family regulator
VGKASRDDGAETAPPPLDDVDAVFLALAHEARRHIVLLLGQRGGELPSGYLAARFQHSWPTTTRHLKVLEAAGIVEVRREGRSGHYRLDRDRLRHVVGGWLRLVEPVGPEQTWISTGPKHSSGIGLPKPKKKKGTRP